MESLVNQGEGQGNFLGGECQGEISCNHTFQATNIQAIKYFKQSCIWSILMQRFWKIFRFKMVLQEIN